MHPISSSGSASTPTSTPTPTPTIKSDPDPTEIDYTHLFDARPEIHATSPVQHTDLITVVFRRIAAAFSDAATWIRQVFSGSSRASPPLISITTPRSHSENREATDPRSPIAKQGAEHLHVRAKTTESLENNLPIGDRLPDSPSKADEDRKASSRHTEATLPSDPDREAFDAYARLCKQDGKPPGEVLIPQNFDKAASAYASEFADRILGSSVVQGQDFHLGFEDQTRLPVAIAVLQQQNDNPLAKSKAKALVEIGPVPVSSAQQATSFMAWRAWKQDPDKFPSDADFSIDAAMRHASELLAQFAGKPQARLDEVKAILNDATELIVQQEAIQKRYNEQKLWREGEQLMSKLLASVEAARPEPVATPAKPVVSSANPVPTAAPVDLRPGPPPPPPPRVRRPSSMPVSDLPETPLPATPAPPPPAPRKQNLPHLVGALPNWTDKQIDTITSAAFPMNHEQVRRGIAGLRSIDWAKAGTSEGFQSASSVDDTERRLNYGSQRRSDEQRLLENLEYAQLLIRRTNREHILKAGDAFRPLADLLAQQEAVSGRLALEIDSRLASVRGSLGQKN